MHNNVKAIVWMIIHIILAAFINMYYRILSESIDKIHIGFLINFYTFLSILPWAIYYRKAIFKSYCWYIHLFRAILTVSSQLLLIYAFSNMRFAQVSAITLTYPLICTIGAAIFFKEKVGLYRSLALIIGFIGALIIINPTYNDFNVYSIFVILAMVFWAGIDMLVRKVGHNENLSIQFFYTIMFLCVVSAFPASLLRLPEISVILNYKFLLLGIFFSIYMLSGFIAIIETECIGIVMPFYFLVLVLSTAIGYYIFDEVIRLSTIIGSSVILCSSSFIAYKEHKTKKLEEMQKQGNLI